MTIFTAGIVIVTIVALGYVGVGWASPKLLGNEKGFKALWYVPELVQRIRGTWEEPGVEDVVKLISRYDKDTLIWELPFKAEDRQYAIETWTDVYQWSHAHAHMTLDEFFQDCPHRDVWTEVQEKAGFGKVVAARCKRCRSTTIALMDDWLDARYKLSEKEGRCCVEVVDKAVCGCRWCENARRPPSQYRDSYGS